MRKAIVGVLLLFGVKLWAGHGIVQTSAGEKFEGEIRLESGAVVISDTNQAATRVELANLSFLRFQTPPPPPQASPPPGPGEGLPGAYFGIPDAKPSSPPPPPPGFSTSPAKLPAGVLLTGGSLIARRISSADETSIRLVDTTNEISLSSVNVARILFQPMPADFEELIQPARTGLLLSSKEFVEGEFKSFADGQITVSSVLFGLKSYDPGQVIAVILRPPKLAPAHYELKTRDESLFLANALRIENDSIVLQDAALAGFRISAAELVEFRKRAE